MDLHRAIRQLRQEKRWFDEVIESVEHFHRSQPAKAVELLERLGARGGLRLADADSRSRRRLSRWLSGLRERQEIRGRRAGERRLRLNRR
jgi:hypothetical protein